MLMTEISVIGDDLFEIYALKYFLNDQFKVKDLGLAHYFLGLQILTKTQGLLVNQQKFLSDLHSEFNCVDSNPMVSHLDIHFKLSIESRDLLQDPSLFRKLVKKLNFLQHT